MDVGFTLVDGCSLYLSWWVVLVNWWPKWVFSAFCFCAASLRAKDEELRRALEEKAAIVAELRVRCLWHHTAVALTFEEMRTPYASGRNICVQKFGNAYQRKEIEKRMPHFVFVWDLLRPSRVFFCVRCTHRFPWFCVHLDFYVLYAEICVNTTSEHRMQNANSSNVSSMEGMPKNGTRPREIEHCVPIHAPCKFPRLKFRAVMNHRCLLFLMAITTKHYECTNCDVPASLLIPFTHLAPKRKLLGLGLLVFPNVEWLFFLCREQRLLADLQQMRYVPGLLTATKNIVGNGFVLWKWIRWTDNSVITLAVHEQLLLKPGSLHAFLTHSSL